ncbi:MAG: tRNA preQ1(34) S-adenosylmethionine ribosyltransferase-isomerase QueA [Verrucomicrobia bacterium]|nr:tRNA preQ1(34) S-adenosylmethionine ribosyltransferase-isomerase QueA [Verrucomicrobiota bacterium]
MSTRTADYDFELPARLIARYPPPGRADARMLVLDRATRTWTHGAFRDFPDYLHAARGDLAVLNDTRVLPARLRANNGALELLVLGPADDADDDLRRVVCLVKPGRRARIGAHVQVGDNHGVVESIQAEGGARVIRFDAPLDPELAGGELPLPPYLDRVAEPLDTERYQTVFARRDTRARAVAAPTAGLHFTPEILQAVPHAFVTLEVGIGTFRTVKTDDLSAHRMHAEKYEISAATAERINAARARGGRLFAVGTTTVRVLEGCVRDPQTACIMPQRGATDIFIHPPKTVRHLDALLTNFHLPKSTLLMLVSAFAGDRAFVLAAYAEAVRAEYRFFSYGDCMLIL